MYKLSAASWYSCHELMYTMIAGRLRLDDGHQHSPWDDQSEMGMDEADKLTWQLGPRTSRAGQVTLRTYTSKIYSAAHEHTTLNVDTMAVVPFGQLRQAIFGLSMDYRLSLVNPMTSTFPSTFGATTRTLHLPPARQP